jgi:glycosyltransferase involved in cell wall biosynthesis
MATANLREKVTIGIPVYNEARFIRETLESVIIQETTVIVADNASTDGTSEICQEYADKGFIKYVRHAKNKGAHANGFFVISKATTPYFMWMGGHDILVPRYAERLLSVMESKGDCVLCGANDYEFIDADSHTIRTKRNFRYGFCLRSANAFIRTAYYITSSDFNGILLGGLYRLTALKEYLFKHGEEEPCEGQDVVMLARLLTRNKIYCSNSIPCGYKMRMHRSMESFYTMSQRQREMQNAPDNPGNTLSVEDFIETAITRRIETLGDCCGIPCIDRKLKAYVHNKIKKKYLLLLLEHEVELYAEGEQDLEMVKRQWKFFENKMNVYISSLVFWDAVSRICLSKYVYKVSRGELALETCLEIKRNLVLRGLRIPILRHIKWYVKYRIMI